ncbi:MAG TPA: hypothetical protein VF103_09770 [Polyangiaceae bacterium]
MKVGLRVGLVVALAVAALVVKKLALPAGLAVLLSVLAIPELEPRSRKLFFAAHALSGVVALAAIGRFLATEALAGIVQGGTDAAGARAVSRLREILFVEDGARKNASWDPDGDRIGSALFLAELTGEAGMRGNARLAPPLLEGYPNTETTSMGPALEIGGFWFAVCLPTRSGAYSSDPKAEVDEERAERRYVAYAWPNGRAPGLERAYFIDEHERILSAPASPTVRTGREHAPRCDDALSHPTVNDWRPWRGKKPRSELPGDR